MIDTLVFFNAVTGVSYDLNTVTNGVGCSLKSFDAHIEEVRHESQDLPYSHGIIQTPTSYGRMIVEMEGDVMHNTATGYWTERMNFLRAFMSTVPTDTAGELRMQLTGQAETWSLDASLIGPVTAPVGLMGSTITPWRLALGGNDPWFRGTTLQSQTIAPATNVAVTNFGGGNAPSWPTFVITGPIINPIILWQGSTYIQYTATLTAGQTININMRTRQSTGPLGNMWTAIVQSQIWLPMNPNTVGALGKNLRLNGSGTSGATTLQINYYNGYVI